LEGNPDEHIGAAELAKLLEESRRRAEPVQAADVHPHFAVCPACREQFDDLALLHHQLDRQLTSMRPAKLPPPQNDCPEPAAWRDIAGGLTPLQQTLAYLEHASRCDDCGPLLREAVAELADLNGEITQPELNLIAILESARAEWQQRLVRRITGTPHSGPGRESARWWRRWLAVPHLAVQLRAVPRLAIAGASFVAIVAVGSWVVLHRYNVDKANRNQPAAASQLLARAYTEKRTLELRIAGADYAPLRVSRGPAASFTSRPEPLLKAEALIASQLESHPSDPSWLQAKAQADVLEGKYDAAVEALRRALELEPHSPALLTDLATAYFQRAQQEERKDDLGAAYEYLSQALRFHPDDPVALFNRAIVAEHQFLYHQALDDWEHYLRVDPGSQWIEEARNRANAIREKLKEHESNATPLLAPEQVAAIATSPSSDSEADQRSRVDQRIEEYLHEAVRSWLPQAFPEARASANNNADPQAWRALFFLADLTSRQHGDRWLADLLRGSSAPHFPRATTALARAVKANDAGEYDVSRQQAELAERLFRASGNIAGALRAEFEQSFAAQMTRRSEACRGEATAALAESEKYSYTWLQIQLGLEKGDCSGLMGDLGVDESAARRAMERARKSGYWALYLRALGFVAGDQRETGDTSEGWRLVSTGLDRYWSGQFPAMRGYNVYTELAYMAEAAAHSHLQMASWREAAALIDIDEDLLLRAMAHWSVADAATGARLPNVAKQHYSEAARLFAAAPRTDASRSYGLENEVRTARLEARQDQPDNGIARLTSIQDRVRGLSNNYLLQMFYSTLGELQLRQRHGAEAEQALRPALALAEKSLASLRSEAERANWSRDAAPAYLALSEAELLQGRSQEALEVYEWYLGVPQRSVGDPVSRRYGNRSRSYSAISDPSRPAFHLPLLAKETVLAYAALPDGLAIWVYDDRGINAHWIPQPTDGLQEIAERFYDLSSDPKSELSALRRDARTLYASLIAPVERDLTSGRTLVIEAGGWLARVPFEALLDSNDRYLIERAPIVHSLGQDSQARLRSDTGISADSSALVVGSTSSSADGLIPLPDVAAEADTVASGFHSARVLKGGEAVLSAVRRELPGATVFHFAGHSLTTRERTGLLLEGGDRPANTTRLMDAAVVLRLPVRGLQLAMLSACSTAPGSGGSSGFNSVTDALLSAGVPHVVASRWAVDSVETRGFVEDFYHNALSGESVSNALRLTSRKMLANPRTSHPYYWSEFVAYGRP
jgi:CHAT domain-containing protein/cytochrome c-type biogenesis protein CcmH/NrfG